MWRAEGSLPQCQSGMLGVTPFSRGTAMVIQPISSVTNIGLSFHRIRIKAVNRYSCPIDITDDEIRHLVSYARGKFEVERYPFAPALKPVREVLAKIDPQPKPEPPPLRKPYVPSLLMQRKKGRR
jgi:hypothetical protein